MDTKHGAPSHASSHLHGVAQKVRMGKKVEKALTKDKNPSSATHLEDDNANKTPEPYKCIGNFLTDFTELCKQNQMAFVPNVQTRPKLPAPSGGGNEGKPDKKGDKKQAQPEPEPEPELNQDGEPIEPPPKTYTTKDKYDYFKPSVQVELDNNDKWDTVAEIYIRGWKIDDPMMEIFHQCLPTLDKLHTINFWNAGLTATTLRLLASFLPQCANLKNVILDGNTVKEENWYELIGEESLIQSLSLRYCQITDKGATSIGHCLGSAKKANTKLVTLNLGGNSIGDPGVEALAGGLRMNRTLMALTLANNQIGDKGVAKLSEALSRFPLSHEEVVERRRLISDRGSPDRNKSEYSMESEYGSRKASVAADAAKTLGKTKDKKKDKGKASAQEAENMDGHDQINPLLEVADYMDGQSWIAGNRTLIMLNLSRNLISETGLSSLLKAIQYQTTLTLDNRSGGTGLMKLTVDKNKMSGDNEILAKLNEKMLTKDPFYKPPLTPEGEAA
ncbi:leucine-rich repeat-containing protein 71-like isoform X4 [Elysia marginata]|uniref:Leucine-rich repeat-containing protein 71-like isoform X4 n=1 Tax=Elysia marginata TaxID=1093978 RepID=A0AAV4G4A3_9GAST|nr:leucine-rich repeat-containing protein 71-like isoform X4 [Elysia marginata]